MHDFNRRWQACVAHARQAPACPAAAPPGFSTRVLASLRHPEREPWPALLWERLGFRALVAAGALLVVLGAMEYRDARRSGLALPNVAHSVTSTLWIL